MWILSGALVLRLVRAGRILPWVMAAVFLGTLEAEYEAVDVTRKFARYIVIETNYPPTGTKLWSGVMEYVRSEKGVDQDRVTGHIHTSREDQRQSKHKASAVEQVGLTP